MISQTPKACALQVVEEFGVQIKSITKTRVKGSYRGEKNIIYLRKDATAYTILHELGHIICGYMCCREHCEYVAHGAALALAKVYNIELDDDIHHIEVYAGHSLPSACGAIQQRKRYILQKLWRNL